MIEQFHFLRPWWLIAIPFALLLAWLASRRSDPRAKWNAFIAPHLLDHLLVDAKARFRVGPAHLMAATIVLGSMAAAGPTWERERSPFVQDTAPLVIAVDLSQTMDAIDVTPSRLERAKLKIRDLLAARGGSRTGVVAYAGSAHTVLPPTEDATLVETYTDALSTAIMPLEGRDTSAALRLARSVLAREPVGGTILLITDGVEDAAFTAFKESGKDGVLVLAVGTSGGGPVKTTDGGFASSASGGRLLARLDVAELAKLHAETGTEFFAMTADDRDVQWALRHVRTRFEQRADDAGDRWQDLGWWFTIPIAAFGALTFRRGWVLKGALLIVSLHLVFDPSPSRAADWTFADLWLTRDQQGRHAFEQGDFSGAAALFRDSAWRATALYRAGKYADAVDSFAALDTADSYFGQGNSLMHLGKFDQAAADYAQALKMRPDWDDAKANRALAERLQVAKKKDEEQQDDASQKPDKVQFDDKGKQGKKALMNIAEQTSEMWMDNIGTSPADLMARRFAIEAKARTP